ncbi:MAG TPA: SLBB domain-containing protein, partial [Candidatus Saccharimonadales bacterium]|nr:SLBB domain-containing protein [Candidatus Saccharimonadales bacterium]
MRLAVPSLDADLTAVKITHSPLASQAPATVNYLAFLDNKDLSGNPVLMDRDVVTVARKSEAALQVGVLGQVAAPGRYQLPSGSTVLDAVRKAQGLTDDADRGHIVVRHANGGAEVTVDYDAAEKSPSTLTANPELNDGDTVTVGGVARPRSYTIAGAVLHPGEYPLPEAPLTLADAIGKAGGLADRPKLDQVSIVRRDASGKVSVVKIKANDPS